MQPLFPFDSVMLQCGGAAEKIGGLMFVGKTCRKLTCVIGVHEKLCSLGRHGFLECQQFRIVHFHDSPYRRLTKRGYPDIGSWGGIEVPKVFKAFMFGNFKSENI